MSDRQRADAIRVNDVIDTKGKTPQPPTAHAVLVCAGPQWFGTQLTNRPVEFVEKLRAQASSLTIIITRGTKRFSERLRMIFYFPHPNSRRAAGGP